MPSSSGAGWNNLTLEAYSVDDYFWASHSSLLSTTCRGTTHQT